jgi:integrase
VTRSRVIDLVIGGKRLRFATGARTPAEFKNYQVMAHALKIQGRIDLLEGCCGDEPLYHPAELLTAFRLNDFDRLPQAAEIGPLDTRWAAWGTHREMAPYAWTKLREAGLTTLRTFPIALKTLRLKMTDTPRGFELYKNEVQAFLRDQVGPEHPTYKAVAKIPGFGKRRRERGRPRSVDEIVQLLRSRPEDRAFAECVVTMCVTGMGNKEYWVDGFDVLADRVEIHGKKRTSRERVVPRWAPVHLPRLTDRQMSARLPKGVGLYDFRRTFARWCEEAGIIESNRAAYMGHGAKTMTQLYTMGELPGQLQADADKLRRYAATLLNVVTTPTLGQLKVVGG